MSSAELDTSGEGCGGLDGGGKCLESRTNSRICLNVPSRQHGHETNKRN